MPGRTVRASIRHLSSAYLMPSIDCCFKFPVQGASFKLIIDDLLHDPRPIGSTPVDDERFPIVSRVTRISTVASRRSCASQQPTVWLIVPVVASADLAFLQRGRFDSIRAHYPIIRVTQELTAMKLPDLGSFGYLEPTDAQRDRLKLGPGERGRCLKPGGIRSNVRFCTIGSIRIDHI
jgi:hypothetical protein